MKTYKKSIEKIDENYYFSAFRLVINKPNPPFFVPKFSAFPSLSQFGQGRLRLDAISFYALLILAGPDIRLQQTTRM